MRATGENAANESIGAAHCRNISHTVAPADRQLFMQIAFNLARLGLNAFLGSRQIAHTPGRTPAIN